MMNARTRYVATVATLVCALSAWADGGAVPPLDSAPLPPSITQDVPDDPTTAPPAASETEAADEVTIVDRNQTRFEEHRIRGHLYKIKVTPRIGAPYYLIDEEGNGIWHRHDALDNNLQPPRWVIFRF